MISIFKKLVILNLVTFSISLNFKTIEVKGNAFFYEGTNERFYIRGLDYQPGGSSDLKDTLLSSEICKRDLKHFKDLGVNTIRVYSIDNTLNHDYCMNLYKDSNIYFIFDVNTPQASLSRSDPKCSYNSKYLEQVFATVSLMSKYDNTLGFFAANEVINDNDTTSTGPYIKALVRDIKIYIKNNIHRDIPVGYSAADIQSNILETVNFLNCGDNEYERVDMMGINDYSWCGSSSYENSGYKNKVSQYGHYSIPLFLSEFGCNKVSPREFEEIQALYSDKMSPVFSGGLVYEYSDEANKYGVVKISLDGKSVEPNKDYENLKKQFESVKNPSGDGGYKKNLKHSDCPQINKYWKIKNNVPNTPLKAIDFINGKKKPSGKGFEESTQWACEKDEVQSSTPLKPLNNNRRKLKNSSNKNKHNLLKIITMFIAFTFLL